jgi:uncharacterized protein YkwD
MNSYAARYLLVFGVCSLLIACGGGGSDTKNNNAAAVSPTSNLLAQSSVSSVANTANSSTTVSSISSASGGLSAPQNPVATPANAAVVLRWDSVAGASSYAVYYASQANIITANIASFSDGNKLTNVTSPLNITALTNGKTYYFVVVAVVGTQESAASREVSATPSAIDLARQPTAQEVLMLELVNRARANPEAEASLHSVGLNDGIPANRQISAAAKQPLAHNLLLIASSRDHSQWMLDVDIFNHTGINGSSPTQRMSTAGYVFSGAFATSGENISWVGTTASSINLTTSVVSQHRNLFRSSGHRENILAEEFRELGIGQKQGLFNQGGTNYLASMVTQNFAKTGTRYFLTGVIYNDTNSNRFYDVGEGIDGVTVTVNNVGYLAYSAGAYAIGLAPGTYDVAITGDALGAPVYRTVTIGSANVKLDLLKSGTSLEVLLR